MKKLLAAAIGFAIAFAAHADGDWRTTLGKVKDLSGDTGISGFFRMDAPDYITGKFEAKNPDGSWAARPGLWCR